MRRAILLVGLLGLLLAYWRARTRSPSAADAFALGVVIWCALLGEWHALTPSPALVTLIAAAATAAILAVALYVIEPRLPISSYNLTEIRRHPLLAGALVLATLAAAITEEVALRGTLLQTVSPEAVVASAVSFASIHIPWGPSRVVSMLIAGTALAPLAVQGPLLGLVIGHLVINTAGIVSIARTHMEERTNAP